MTHPLRALLSISPKSDNLTNLDQVVEENPELFPDRECAAGRRSVSVGRLVKLMAGGAAESFWVEVIDKTEKGLLIGRIDSPLQRADIHGLNENDIIVFGPQHIRDVSYGPDEPRPTRYDQPLIMHMGDGKPMTYADPMGGDWMTVEEFKDSVAVGAFIDYDGYALPVARTCVASDWSERIFPSAIGRLPADATHVIWFNR